MKPLLSLTLPLLLLGGCTANETDTNAEANNVMQTSREWSAVAATGNTDSILSYWHDDAVVISAGDPPLKGKSAIRQMVETSFSAPDFSINWVPESAEVSKCGDMAYLIENTNMSMKDSLGNDRQQRFKTVTIWKKQDDGQWKAVVDVMSPLPQ